MRWFYVSDVVLGIVKAWMHLPVDLDQGMAVGTIFLFYHNTTCKAQITIEPRVPIQNMQ